LVPHAVAIDEDEVFALTRWVEAGGVLVVGPLAGHRDENLQGPRRLEPPGAFAPLSGTANGEATTWPRELQVRGIGGGAQVLAGCYGEIIEPGADNVTVVATYLTDWLAGRPAVCERRVGAGRVIHCGVPLGDAIVHWLWEELHLPQPDLALLTHENGAEVLTRVCDDYALHFAINHGAGPAVFQVRRPLADLATGQAVTNSFTLQPSGWRVVREYLT
jgi:beta-galactosidase